MYQCIPTCPQVDGKRYRAKNILIAVGGTPSKLNIPGAELCITSDEALELPDCPKKVCIRVCVCIKVAGLVLVPYRWRGAGNCSTAQRRCGLVCLHVQCIKVVDFVLLHHQRRGAGATRRMCVLACACV